MNEINIKIVIKKCQYATFYNHNTDGECIYCNKQKNYSWSEAEYLIPNKHKCLNCPVYKEIGKN